MGRGGIGRNAIEASIWDLGFLVALPLHAIFVPSLLVLAGYLDRDQTQRHTHQD